MLVPLGQYTVTPKRLNPPCASGSLQMCPALLEPTPQLFMHHALLCCVVLCCLFVRRCWLHWVQTQQAVSSWSQTAPSPTTYPTLRTRKPWQRLWTWYRSQVRAVGQIAGPAGAFCTLLGRQDSSQFTGSAGPMLPWLHLPAQLGAAAACCCCHGRRLQACHNGCGSCCSCP